MSTPIYIPDRFADIPLDALLGFPWEQHRPTRRECFMSDPAGVSYTYGKNVNAETYLSIPMDPIVARVMADLNREHGSAYNGCFLNRYEDHLQHLGWHADDFEGMDLDHPIASVSFGQPREIWWRENGFKGEIPPEWRRMLGHGSVFIMPGGFQDTHQHRVPKGDRNMGVRVSMTFRRFLPS
jgi:alkylated DNA repair dioxygenase AlkB